MAAGQATDADFDRLSWHDNVIHGFRISLPEPELGDWRSDLILDIDYIVEWLCGDPQDVRFRVAPADLVFHDVGDLKIGLEYPSGMLSEISINTIHRMPAKPAHDRGPPSYDWRIEVHAPPRAALSFRASGFTQTLRGEPLTLPQQSLTRAQRAQFRNPAAA